MGSRTAGRSIDVIVTVDGYSRDTIAAVQAGGGLVGLASDTTTVPESVGVEFVDWPFLEDRHRDTGFPVDDHVAAVAAYLPRYAVAPDVEPPRSLDEVLRVADRLDRHAEQVIVVPKTVDPARIPECYRVGVPFRNEFSTSLFTNTFDDFRGLEDVHILGGNPNHQFILATRYELDVGSVDTPKILAWANGGRVFVADGAGGVGTRALAAGIQEFVATRADRIAFSVGNMVEAWQYGRVTYVLEAEPGRGPPPAPPPGTVTPIEREGFLERHRRRPGAIAQGRLGDRPTEAVTQTTLGQVPASIVRDEAVEDLEREGIDVVEYEQTDLERFEDDGDDGEDEGEGED